MKRCMETGREKKLHYLIEDFLGGQPVYDVSLVHLNCKEPGALVILMR